MIRRWLVRLATWTLHRLDAWPSHPVPIIMVETPPEIEPYLETARSLTQAHADAPQSGEWKRHQVYAALHKSHPTARSRDLALAIEWALRQEN